MYINRAQAMAIWSYFSAKGFGVVETITFTEQRTDGELWFTSEGQLEEILIVPPAGGWHHPAGSLENGPVANEIVQDGRRYRLVPEDLEDDASKDLEEAL